MQRLRLSLIMVLALLLASGVFAQDDGADMGVLLGEHEGYTLYTLRTSNYVYLVDDAGRIVQDWVVSGNGRDAVLRENGNLVVSVAKQETEVEDYAAGIAFVRNDGRFEEYTWDGELVWSYEFDRPGYQIHHGIEVLPNGNIMFIAWDYKTVEEAIANGRDPEFMGNGLWPDVILEYSPEVDDIVWEWHVWDHMIQDFDPDQANFGVVENHPELIDINYQIHAGNVADWQHANSIDYNPQLDQIVFSVREFSEFWIIDKSTTTEEAAGEAGHLLYRWGNPAAYNVAEESERQISYQHDAQWVPEGYPGAGNIMLFSNRHSTDPDATFEDVFRGSDHSRVIEMTPPLLEDGTYQWPEPGEAFAPAEPSWVLDGFVDVPFHSWIVSGVQRLPNGNTLVTPGQEGRVFEVTPEKEVVWDYRVPMNEISILPPGSPESALDALLFRVKRYQPDYPALAGRDLSEGVLPQELASSSMRYPAFIENGFEVDGELTSEVPARYYAFRVESVGNVVDVALDVQDGESDALQMTLIRRDMDVVAEAAPTEAGLLAISNLVVESSGWYFVEVTGDVEQPVTYQVSRTVENVFADVDPEIPRFFYGSEVQDRISSEDPESQFVFFGFAGDVIRVRMQRDNDSLDPVVEVLDADGETLVRAEVVTDQPVALIDGFEIPADGVYFIRATRYEGDERPSDTSGVYTMTLDLVTE